MEKHHYEQIVTEKARELQQRVDHTVSHGSDGVCPGCGHSGFYDLQGLGVTAGSIFFNTIREQWSCMLCELDPVGY